jgi:hypothetical protein
MLNCKGPHWHICSYYSFLKCFESYFTVQEYMCIAMNDTQRKPMLYVKYFTICFRAQDIVSNIWRWDNVYGCLPVMTYFERYINEIFNGIQIGFTMKLIIYCITWNSINLPRISPWNGHVPIVFVVIEPREGTISVSFLHIVNLKW